VQRHPLLWAAAGSGSCLAVAFGLIMFAANVLDPHGLGNPSSGTLCGLVAFVAMITALGVARSTGLAPRRSSGALAGSGRRWLRESLGPVR
jgi:hypothetical protein